VQHFVLDLQPTVEAQQVEAQLAVVFEEEE
jgi:hypothetical protein